MVEEVVFILMHGFMSMYRGIYSYLFFQLFAFHPESLLDKEISIQVPPRSAIRIKKIKL